MRKFTVLLLSLVGLALLLSARPAAAQSKIRDVTDDDVDRAIGRAVRWIYGRQTASGAWPSSYYNLPAGGTTAISLFALLEAGENPENEAIVKGIDSLIKVETNFLYVRALRVMVLAQAGGRKMKEEHKKVFLEDLKWLTKNLASQGAWGYAGPDRSGDNSCSQFALLALWEAMRAREELDQTMIRSVERTWLSRQKPDGGWTYAVAGKGEPTASMTAAGVASMFVCQDALVAGQCRPYMYKKQMDRGIDWLAANLKDDYIDDGYLAFCVQRVGMAGGLKFIGKMDWYATGAKELVKPQPYGPSYKGQWGPEVRAAFELIFLARGRTPLVFNKLEHGTNSGWDTHPRDVAQLAEYLRRTFERRMRWQVVSISDDLRMLLDAPVLAVTANKPLEFDTAQWAKLREYTLRGGTLLLMPVHFNKAFVDDAKAKLDALYAEQRAQAGGHFQLVQLPADDPLYAATDNLIPNADRTVPLFGLHDGTRWIALLSPEDLGCTWQKYQTLTKQQQFTLGASLFLYATGANKTGSRMRPVFVGADNPVRETAKIGWVRHDGNWHTQPFALEYLNQKLAAENRLAIDVTADLDAATADLSPYRLLWITGSGKADWTDAQVAGLRRYLDNNGTIFINAVGGAKAFNESIDALVRKLADGRVGGVAGLPVTDPLLTGKLGEHRGLPLENLKRSRAWMLSGQGGGSAPFEAYIENGHARVIIARRGVHDTLDGHTAWGAISFMPPAAGQIAANIVLYSLMDRPKPELPQTQPAEPDTQPAEPETQPADSPTDTPAAGPTTPTSGQP